MCFFFFFFSFFFFSFSFWVVTNRKPKPKTQNNLSDDTAAQGLRQAYLSLSNETENWEVTQDLPLTADMTDAGIIAVIDLVKSSGNRLVFFLSFFKLVYFVSFYFFFNQFFFSRIFIVSVFTNLITPRIMKFAYQVCPSPFPPFSFFLLPPLFILPSLFLSLPPRLESQELQDISGLWIVWRCQKMLFLWMV